MGDTEFLQQHTDAAKESSNRTRQILLLMIIASILVFAAYWNSRGDSWGSARLALAKASVDILEGQPIPLGEEELYKQAKETVSTPPTTSLEQAKANLSWIQKVRAEQLSLIHVPFLGINFDVNDLGMLGGFAFVVLLILVNYSLWHHSTNLDLALNLAEKLQDKGEADLLYFTYQNLAMRQVLTIPPKPKQNKTEKDGIIFWIQNISKSLYALPLAVQMAVVWHDLDTIGIGEALSQRSTRMVTITEIIFLCLILILTALCFYMWGKTYNTWQKFAEKI
jgi:hypothetical protein